MDVKVGRLDFTLEWDMLFSHVFTISVINLCVCACFVVQFPPYATNETGRPGMLGRRELGHGVYIIHSTFSQFMAAGHSVLPLYFRSVFIFRCLISEVA